MTRTVHILPDGKCNCSVADPCPLGRSSQAQRCSDADLIASGVSTTMELPSGFTRTTTKAPVTVRPSDLLSQTDIDNLADIIWWIRGATDTGGTCPFNAEHIESLRKARILALRAKGDGRS